MAYPFMFAERRMSSDHHRGLFDSEMFEHAAPYHPQLDLRQDIWILVRMCI